MDRLLWLLPTVLLLLYDRLLKLWAVCALELGRPVPLVGNAIRLSRVHNTGGAFGLFPGNPVVFIAVSALISVALLIALLAGWAKGRWMRLGVCVLLAGAVGNLIDRAAYGFVVDFFEIRGFPVFNLADACVTVGAVLVIVQVFFGGGRHRSRRHADHP